MLFGLYFGNLLFYVTGAVLVVRGGKHLVRWMRLTPPVIRIIIALVAAALAPALASMGHLLILVPFAVFPRFYVYGRGLLPWNVALSALTAAVAVTIYNRRIRSSEHP